MGRGVFVVGSRCDRIARHAGSGPFTATVSSLGLGAGLLVASVASDFEAWWALGSATLVDAPLHAARLARG